MLPAYRSGVNVQCPAADVVDAEEEPCGTLAVAFISSHLLGALHRAAHEPAPTTLS